MRRALLYLRKEWGQLPPHEAAHLYGGLLTFVKAMLVIAGIMIAMWSIQAEYHYGIQYQQFVKPVVDHSMDHYIPN